MASGPITSWQIGEIRHIQVMWPQTSWQIEREKVKAMTDFIFLGPDITSDSNCSHETERCLLLGRKVMINLDGILKSRDIALPTKIHIVKAVVFPVVMYGCESQNIKKAECRGTDVFELWCWRRPSRVPWTARRSNQSILKGINYEYSLEGLMPKLKLQYFGQLIRTEPTYQSQLIRTDPDPGKD